MSRKSRRVRFPGALGSDLAAHLDYPPEPRAWALLAHCFTCSKDLKSLRRLSSALVERGIAVLRFDFTGLGESSGDFADTDFSSNLDDLVAAADWLRENHEAPQLLVGHSLGGAAVLAAAPRIEEVRAVATLGAPSDPAHLKSTALRDVDPDEEVSEVTIAGRSFRVGRQLLEDIEEQRLLDRVAELGRALLVMHSPIDEVVGVDHARRIYEAAKHPKSFLSLDNADHLLLGNPRDAEYAGEMLACWASRYLEPSAQREEEALPQGVVEVRGGTERYTQRIRAREHVVLADEPESLEGSDRGPTPYEYLLAALGSCISITLRMYADRKGMPLEGVRVRLRHDRIHAEDCESCVSEEGKVSRIGKQLELEGPELSDEQRQRLEEISRMCPVHRTLSNEIAIESMDSFDD